MEQTPFLLFFCILEIWNCILWDAIRLIIICCQQLTRDVCWWALECSGELSYAEGGMVVVRSCAVTRALIGILLGKP